MNRTSAVAPEWLEERFGPLLGVNKADSAQAWADLLVRRDFEAGAHVCARGQETGSLFLVESGRLSVSVEADEASRSLGELGPGDWFGELGLLVPAPGTADVTALEACKLLELDQGAWAKLEAEHPNSARALLHCIDEVLSKRILTARGQDTEPSDSRGGLLTRLMSALFGTQEATL